MNLLRRRLRRRVSPIWMPLFLLMTVWYITLPPHSPIRLSVNFNLSRYCNAVFSSAANRDAWLFKPSRYPVELNTDVGYLIKTGYGTRHRIPEQLSAFSRSGGVLGDEGRSYMVVGDWTAVNDTDAQLVGAEVHDVIKLVMETKVDRKHRHHRRFTKYRSLQASVAAGDEVTANSLGKAYGWELDALKFIIGMELLYKKMPNKKWYIILDDDTFLVRSSLRVLLSHLDPSKPHYIGNAVGDYKSRFGHGGSGVIISGKAMDVLFSRKDIIAKAYMESLDETWGDRLVATTLQKVGVYIDERYSHHFNGEAPELTRIRADRACSPVVSFHGLRKPGAMVSASRVLGKFREPVLWGQLWDLFASVPLGGYADGPLTSNDHVGPTDEHENIKRWTSVNTAQDCRRKCERSNKKWCMAWTYDERQRQCFGSPWFIAGDSTSSGYQVSGVNWPKVKPLLQRCSVVE